jgi:hypothetical protein
VQDIHNVDNYLTHRNSCTRKTPDVQILTLPLTLHALSATLEDVSDKYVHGKSAGHEKGVRSFETNGRQGAEGFSCRPT